MTEEWREVPSFPGYYASSLGRIRGRRGHVLSPSTSNGYLRVKPLREGRIFLKGVHQLVCEAFHGVAPSPKHQAAHGNGVRHDNRSDNLRWATYRENRDDMRIHGTQQIGEKHPRAGLTQAQADEIRARCEALLAARILAGHQRIPRGTREALAKEFNVSIHVIKDLLGRRSWTGGAA